MNKKEKDLTLEGVASKVKQSTVSHGNTDSSSKLYGIRQYTCCFLFLFLLYTL